MLFLDTDDTIRVTSSAAATLDITVGYIDVASGAGTGGTQKTAMTTATTTAVLGSPASGFRRLAGLNIRNKHASLASDVTVIFRDNATDYELQKYTLNPGEVLEYIEGVGFWKQPSNIVNLITESTAQQGAGFATDTYLTGSGIVIPAGLPVVGTEYRLWFDVVKTAVGTATPIINIRIGSAGTTGDTSRLTFTWGAGTAAIDTAVVECKVIFRSIGSGTSAVLQGSARAVTNLSTTGWSNAVKALQVTGSGFDSSAIAGQTIGASYNGGASASHTVQLTQVQLIP